MKKIFYYKNKFIKKYEVDFWGRLISYSNENKFFNKYLSEDSYIVNTEPLYELYHDTNTDLLARDNFKQLVNEASTDLNYRLAVRYYYLWVLKELSAAKFIHYDVEKTNSDYQFELLNTEMKKPFLYTSYLYNYIWYGEFEVNTLEFEKARTAFDQLLNQISGE